MLDLIIDEFLGFQDFECITALVTTNHCQVQVFLLIILKERKIIAIQLPNIDKYDESILQVSSIC